MIDVAKLRALAADLRQHDSVFWRRAVDLGVVYGPEPWIRYSPAFFGLAFGAALPKHRRAVLRNLRLALGPRSAPAELRDAAAVFVVVGVVTIAWLTVSAPPDLITTAPLLVPATVFTPCPRLPTLVAATPPGVLRLPVTVAVVTSSASASWNTMLRSAAVVLVVSSDTFATL